MTEQEAELDLLVEKEYERVPALRPEPDMQRVREARTVLDKAQKPVIVAGGGVVRSGAQQEPVAFAQKLRIPVITSLTGTMIDFKHATQRYFSCAGSLGWGFPAALGVKCALPDKPVLCFTGDGGFYYHITELETARRYHISLVVLVNNNSGLNQEITLNKINYGGKPRGNWTDLWTFTDNNFAKIAEAFGCAGIRVEKPGEIKDALSHAFGMKKPVVIDVVSDVNVLAKKVPH